MVKVILLLGSNISKEVNIPAAVTMLHKAALVKKISSIYETAPMGLTEQSNFFNLAVLIETKLSPSQIKQKVIDPIEKALHRVRQEDKNAPRTIDIDIVLYGDQVINYEGADGIIRHLPDADLLDFAHVAVPVAELAPEMIHPITGQTLAAIAQELLDETHKNEADAIWKRDDLLLNFDKIGIDHKENLDQPVN